jgi:hypothetical protein
MAVGAYTGAVLISRKLLMNVSAAEGAKPGLPFTDYVDHLVSRGYVPPNAKAWVDKIRTTGNEKNHEVHLASREEAEELLSFIEMILKLIYEFPARGGAPTGSTP